MRQLRAADLFCGAGGTSIGAEQSGEASVKFAVNHWDVAVETHSANFPAAMHVNSRLDQVSPGECPKIDLLFASPECTHHSRARGGRPTSDQQRSGAWDIMPWIEHHRPSFVVVENVREWEQWGPVGDNGRPLVKYRGRFFSAWLNAVQSAGYRTEIAHLNAADFGAATSRERMFVLARKGNRSPRVPEPTHAKRPGNALPGMQRHPWRAAAEIIDWEIPCPSVFSRKRPLADKTLLRIEAGLRRFVEPFVVRFRNMDASDARSPLGTVSAGGGHHGVAVPLLVSVNHGDARHSNGRTADLGSPLGTITGANGRAVAVPLVMSTLGGGVARSVGQPAPTITAHGGAHFIVPYLGESPGQSPRTHDSAEPLPTIATSNPKGLAVPLLRQRRLHSDRLAGPHDRHEGSSLTDSRDDRTLLPELAGSPFRRDAIAAINDARTGCRGRWVQDARQSRVGGGPGIPRRLHLRREQEPSHQAGGEQRLATSGPSDH